jgi:hypothetical protein
MTRQRIAGIINDALVEIWHPILQACCRTPRRRHFSTVHALIPVSGAQLRVARFFEQACRRRLGFAVSYYHDHPNFAAAIQPLAELAQAGRHDTEILEITTTIPKS